MTVNSISSSPQQQISAFQNQQFAKPVTPKNDGDGDEINGADPANEKAKNTIAQSSQQNPSSGTGNTPSVNSVTGGNLNTFA